MADTMGAMPVYEVGGGNGDGAFGGSGGFMWVFFLFFLLAWGGNGLGGFGGGANSALTQAEMQSGFYHNQVAQKLDGLSQGLCSLGYENSQLFSQTQRAIDGLGFSMQNCCCETNRNIDSLRYENAKNTCEVVQAIHADGEATRALINANTMQELRDKLQEAQLALSNNAQTQTLINQLKPCAIPAYITCSPYTSNVASCGCGG